MLNLNFFSRGTKPNSKWITYEWTTIYCTDADYEEDGENENNEFEGVDYKIAGIKVFKSYNIEEDYENKNLLKSIKEIVKENRPEAILLSTTSLFRKAMHFSESSEMEPKMTITEDRMPIFYAMVGKDNCALLIAWDKYLRDEEE